MKPRFNAVRILMGETQPSRRANNPPSETREARAFSLSLSLYLSLSLSLYFLKVSFRADSARDLARIERELVVFSSRWRREAARAASKRIEVANDYDGRFGMDQSRRSDFYLGG